MVRIVPKVSYHNIQCTPIYSLYLLGVNGVHTSICLCRSITQLVSKLAFSSCVDLLTTWWQIRRFLEHKWLVKLHKKGFWKNKWWLWITLKLFIYINMCFILPTNQQIANEGWFFDLIYQYKLYVILWLPQNIVTEMKKTAHIQKLWEMFIYETSIWQMTKIGIYYLSMCLSQ